MKARLTLITLLLLFTGLLLIESSNLYATNIAKIKLCHVTGKVIDAANNKCRGYVREVAQASVSAHEAHGDVVPADQDAFEVGQAVVMNCTP